MRFSGLKGQGRMLRGVLVAVLAFGSNLSPAMAASPPPAVNYQGVLRDQNDVPLSGNYDMRFKFWDAATAGNEILIDEHILLAGGQVTVTGGLLNVALGSGNIVDGSGPGTYTSLDAVFRDFGSVWLEIQVAAETLSPRTQLHSSAYALNATNLAGHPGSYYLDTSSSAQEKIGQLNVYFDNQTPDPDIGAVHGQSSQTGISGDGPRNGVTGTSSTGYAGFFNGLNGVVSYSQGGWAGWYLGGFHAEGSSASRPSGQFHMPAGVGGPTSIDTEIATTTSGISTSGGDFGGYFQTTRANSIGVHASAADTGVRGVGGTFGGYFQGTSVHGIYATGPDHGVDADAGNYGGFFEANGVDSYGVYASGLHTGVWGRGNTRGGRFSNFSGANSDVGTSTHKIIGTGSVSFVQNHPTDSSKVIVYAAPEGDEVAVYTRGSGRLVNGEAHVKLGETFALVTNPDIGLTATATPRGEPVALAVSEVSPGELVVRGPAGSRAEFDYMVWGLRIGFEEQSVIRPKKDEAKIPSMHDHEEFFKEHPTLRKHTALARFKEVEERIHGRKNVDLARADHLRDAVGVYVYGQPAEAPREEANGPVLMPVSGESRNGEAIPADGAAPGSAEAAKGAAGSPGRSGDASEPVVRMSPATTVLDRFNREGAIDPGDVVSLTPEVPGAVRRSSGATDALVIGCVQPVDSGTATADSSRLEPAGPVAVATSHVALCRVDASYGAIAVGDRLSLSPSPGAGMRVDPAVAGAIQLGRAIDPLPSGIGLIRVLLGGR
jgi:hypothetical protein